MERLTKRLSGGAVFADNYTKYGPNIAGLILDRLAAYEDKGVAPEDTLSAVEIAKVACKLTVADAYIATGLMPERVAELAQAEKDGRLVVSRFKPGDCVWVIERDEYGEALDVAGSMFLAEVLGAVIVSAYINDMTEAEETLSYHMQETVENYDTTLMVFPSEDVYQTKAEAEAALMEADENA
ncbi:MAG: hypothetical protein HFF04_00905 [Oscillospiraceae bacterium]|nr:hypothetical protein [Oscillospiraceae bacterium]